MGVVLVFIYLPILIILSLIAIYISWKVFRKSDNIDLLVLLLSLIGMLIIILVPIFGLFSIEMKGEYSGYTKALYGLIYSLVTPFIVALFTYPKSKGDKFKPAMTIGVLTSLWIFPFWIITFCF